MRPTRSRTRRRAASPRWLSWLALAGPRRDWPGHSAPGPARPPARQILLGLFVAALVVATCAASLALPHLFLPVSAGGGLLIGLTILGASGRLAAFRVGLREVEQGAWPEARLQGALLRQYIRDQLIALQQRRADRRAGEEAQQAQQNKEEAS